MYTRVNPALLYKSGAVKGFSLHGHVIMMKTKQMLGSIVLTQGSFKIKIRKKVLKIIVFELLQNCTCVFPVLHSLPVQSFCQNLT